MEKVFFFHSFLFFLIQPEANLSSQKKQQHLPHREVLDLGESSVKATFFCLTLSNFSDTLWAFITQSYTLTMKQAPKCFFCGLTNTIYVGMALRDCTVGLVLSADSQTKKSTAKHHSRSGIMLKWITLQYLHQLQFNRGEKQRKLCF